MLIISWNINGIRAIHNKGLLVPFVKKYKPDILCLQETKAEQNQSEVDLPDYEEYWNSAKRKGYSGTATFIKKTFRKPLSVSLNLPEKIVKKYNLSDDGFGDVNNEGRILTLEFEKFFIVNVYTPNSKRELTRLKLRHKKWDPAFLEYVRELENGSINSPQGKPVIFCGDLNVAHTENDLANPDTNHMTHGFTDEEREGIQKVIDSDFVDTFRMFTSGNGHYTWWSPFRGARSRNIGWRIDYIFVSAKLKNKIKSVKILPNVMGSDHCPVTLEIN